MGKVMTGTSKCPFLAGLESQKRLTEARYDDETGETVYSGGADPVDVARGLFDQDGATVNESGISALFTTFGQFLDHDLVLTPEDEEAGHIDLNGMPHGITRSKIAEGTGVDGPRAPSNVVTWQIDGSQVYGSTEGRESDLRSFEGGKLKMADDETSANHILPDANTETLMAGDIEGENPVHLAGDIRANENPNLLSMHTLFAREHNYWAEKLAAAHADWDDDQLFEAARSIVEHELQQITYDEWLPHLLGDELPPYEGHDPDAEGEMSVEFSTAAFRFGHTLVTETLSVQDDDGTQIDTIGLMDAFFDHTHIEEHGADAFLRGQMSTSAEKLDAQIVDALNFGLESPDGTGGFSLAAFNLARGLDHGLQSYIDTRAALLGDVDTETLDPNDFSVITSDPELQARLASVYDTVQDVDLWAGGLSEDPMPGGMLGPLFSHIVTEQFVRTRAADESYGQLSDEIDPDLLAEVYASRMADIIERNTDIDVVQDDPFVAEIRGLTFADAPEGTRDDDTIEIISKDIEDTVETLRGDDSVTIKGGAQLRDGLDTGSGDDTVTMSSGDVHNAFITGTGNDTVALSGTAEVDCAVATGAGDDTVTMQDMARITGDLSTWHDNDDVTLSDKASVTGDIRTGDGDDRIVLEDEASARTVQAGAGSDTIVVGRDVRVDTVFGGDDFDRLVVDGPYRVDWGPAGPDGGAGTIVYLDETGAPTGETLVFKEIESIACFTPGTRILTELGHQPIEDLRVGDRVWTLDAGLQPVRWIGTSTVQAHGDLAPVRIAKGALGNSRDMCVSPQHRMFLEDWRVALVSDQDEALVPAIGLLNDATITRQSGGFVTYIHLSFDTHQIVMADGIPSESFLPGAQGLKALPDAALAELARIFPDLDDIAPARPVLTGPEQKLLKTLEP